MKLPLLALATAFLLSACLPQVKGGAVVDADAAKVASCTFVTNVSGITQSRGGTKSAIGEGMNVARAEAQKAGATDIVWDPITNPDIATVSGKAYRCGN